MKKINPIRKIGPLDAIEIPGTPDGPCIVVFHGFGASAYDLLSLGRLIDAPNASWYFVQGPLKVSVGGVFGRAWFPFDVPALDDAVRRGIHIDYSKYPADDLARIREQSQEFLDTLKRHGPKLVLMGFSQGSMVATDLALSQSEKIAGLVILSGNLINKDVWTKKALTKVGLAFFQSHGEWDPLLGIEYAKDLYKLLTDAGLKGDFHAFRGGHEIPQEIIFKLGLFLKKVLTLHS